MADHDGQDRDALEQTDTLSYTSDGPPLIATCGMDELAEGSRVGRYEITRAIGRGGMGRVYEARDPELGRSVALKFLLVSPSGSPDRERRLRREAQAMAKLSHPNVCTIYDVGSRHGELFVTMELVEGGNLREWLAEEDRSVPELLDMFVAAGRGLAAAHRAGIVHRDFKPANVLVGEDGRPRVSDFGLARSQQDLPDDSRDRMRESALDVKLTQTGSLLGTPRYMSPEQHLGAKVDVRSDLFSFCVALWEAAYGQPPFPGDTVAALADAVLEGKIDSPPQSTEAPRWLEPLLRRGLAVSPDDRFGSMDELLEALDQKRTGKRRAAVLVGGVALIGLVAGGLWYANRDQGGAVCSAAPAHVAEVWGPSVRDATRSALANASARFGPAVAERAVSRLDKYFAGWQRTHAATCRATRVSGEQSERLLDLRMSCLDQHLSQAARVVTVFGDHPDAKLLDSVPKILASLPRSEDCSEADVQQKSPLPADEVTRTRVALLQQRAATARADHLVGRYRGAARQWKSLIEDAKQVGYKPLRVRIGLLAARTFVILEQYKRARRVLADVVLLGSEERMDKAVADAWLERLYVETHGLEQAATAERLLEPTAAAVKRAGDRPDQLAQLVSARAGVLGMKGKRLESAKLYARSAKMYAALGDDYSRYMLAELTNQANELFFAGKTDKAAAIYRKLVPMTEREYGESHPEVVDSLGNLSNTLRRGGKLAEAQRVLERAIRLARQHDPNNPKLPWLYTSLGNVEQDLNQIDKAIEHHRKALNLKLARYGAEHREVASGYVALAGALCRRKRDAECHTISQKGIALVAKTYGKKHRLYAGALMNYGIVYKRQGDCNTANEYYSRALASWEARLGKKHPRLSLVLNSMSECALRLGKAKQAIPMLQRAIPLSKQISPVLTQLLKFQLGMAYWYTGEKQRGDAMANQVLVELEKFGPAGKPYIKGFKRWLKTRKF